MSSYPFVTGSCFADIVFIVTKTGCTKHLFSWSILAESFGVCLLSNERYGNNMSSV